MSVTRPVLTSFVIYAKDIDKVAAFYERTLRLSAIERERTFILVGKKDLEVAVVQVPEELAKEIDISNPPRIREETPLKLSFLVDDLSHVHAEAKAAGGGTKPIGSAWEWRGQLHLDGHDPEGNVVQFRKPDA